MCISVRFSFSTNSSWRPPIGFQIRGLCDNISLAGKYLRISSSPSRERFRKIIQRVLMIVSLIKLRVPGAVSAALTLLTDFKNILVNYKHFEYYTNNISVFFLLANLIYLTPAFKLFCDCQRFYI